MITVGIDEVGRGCWAGPQVAAAVVLGRPIPGLKDSKKLSKLQREKLAKVIENKALAIGIGWV
jgi:ribonuclease HII